MKRFMQAGQFLSISLGVLATLAVPASAIASVVPQTTAGALGNCETSGGSLGLWNQGIISNQSTSSTMSARCTLSRASQYTQSGTRSIHVRDNNISADIKCSAYEVNAYGTSWNWSGWKESAGKGLVQTMTWDSVGTLSTQGFTAIYCILPKRDTSYGSSYLTAFRVGD